MSDNEPSEVNQNPSTPQTASLETERKIAQKLVSHTAQSFIQWMPLGGSGFALFSFLWQQEWVMAVLTFPVTMVTVVWAAYTESFLTTLQAVSKQRGQQDAYSLIAFFKNIDETIRWQLAGTKYKYLQCQGNDCVHYTTEGVARIFKPLLKDVFVPLDLSGNFFRGMDGEALPLPPGFRWDQEIIQRLQKDEGLRIWDVLKKGKNHSGYRHLVILAWGGYGKTTLLRHITYIYTQKGSKPDKKVPNLIPVLLYLRQWQNQITSEFETLNLPTLIEQYHIPSLPEGKALKSPPNWIKNQLKTGKMLVMLDGLDEVKEDGRDRVMQWINKAIQDYHSSFFILTSRPSGYLSYVKESQLDSLLYVKPLNQLQQERFIQNWYLSQERRKSAEPNNPSVKQEADQQATNLILELQASSELQDLSKNPLLLNIITNLHNYYAGEKLPSRKTDLYQEIFQLQLGDRPSVKKINMILEAKDSQIILQKLALEMLQSNTPKIELEELLQKLEVYIHQLGETVTPQKFLQQIEKVSELLVKRDRDYEFAHLSFQNYLAAVEIKEKNQEKLLIQHCHESWWRETIQLYAAQLKPADFNNFISQFCDIATPEVVDIAYSCLREYSRQIDLNLKARVQDLRYQPLENYLKNQQWMEADKETAKVMLQTVGKDKNQILTAYDIQTFPCKDLRRIDQLWVEYSDGRFGFSVQKKIYLDCGAKPNGEYPGDEIWKNFLEEVRKNLEMGRMGLLPSVRASGNFECLVSIFARREL